MFAYGPADATASPKPHHLLLRLNRDLFYVSGTGLPLTQVVLEKRSLNGRTSSSSSSSNSSSVVPCDCVVGTERLLAGLVRRDTSLIPGNDRFRRGDRVVVRADPHQFREMQTERYGGWNDDMALVRQRLSISIRPHRSAGEVRLPISVLRRPASVQGDADREIRRLE